VTLGRESRLTAQSTMALGPMARWENTRIGAEAEAVPRRLPQYLGDDMATKEEVLAEWGGYALVKVIKSEEAPPSLTETFELRGPAGSIKSYDDEDDAIEAFVAAIEAISPEASVAEREKFKR
jgi:hypothetical protein